MNSIKSDNYVVIQGFMIKDLELKGTELFVYAIIYGFSQDGESYFTGSRNYLAKWCNVSLPTIDIALKNLCEKGYIIKEQNVVNNVTFNRYKVVLGVVKKFYGGSKEILGGSKKILGGSKKTLHNNILNNKEYNNINNINNICSRVVGRLNELNGTKYSPTSTTTVKFIKGRIDEGHTEEELLLVVEKMSYLWNQKENEHMKQYLRPSTLFRPTNFENYLNMPVSVKRTTANMKMDLQDFFK